LLILSKPVTLGVIKILELEILWNMKYLLEILEMFGNVIVPDRNFFTK